MKWLYGAFSLLFFLHGTIVSSQENIFDAPVETAQKPWTNRSFDNDPDNFQFAIVTDRTGGHRPGVFGLAVDKLNLLRPEFVMSVGDLIEGYTEDEAELDAQWSEFNDILSALNMRFFYLPGNHDISNAVMREAWLRRYGRSYYHFRYRDVLFLAMDSNDAEDDGAFSDEQIDYFRQVLADNQDVRWTLLFMHHPVWRYGLFNRFAEMEEALGDRPYTVFAGHVHRYQHDMRNDRRYYTLATTGGGSDLRGPKFGEYDHVTWVTMSNEGPSVINLKLDGLIDHEVVTEREAAMARALTQSTQFPTLMTMNAEQTAGKLLFGVKNTGEDTLHFSGRIFHNHHLALDAGRMALTIAPGATEQAIIRWQLSGDQPWERADPIEIDFTIGYATEPLAQPFELSGTHVVPKVIQTDQVRFIEVFTEERGVMLETDLTDMDLRYTLDGTRPGLSSAKYEGPFPLGNHTMLRVALFDPADGTGTDFVEKIYEPTSEVVLPETFRPGLRYRYYEGQFATLPRFDTLTALRAGTATDFEITTIAGEREDHYAIRYEGFYQAPETGMYTFVLYSDDGSRLYLHDDVEVVDNDGSHNARRRLGRVMLNAGPHPIRIDYFEDYSGQVLRLYVQGPGDEEPREIDFSQLRH